MFSLYFCISIYCQTCLHGVGMLFCKFFEPHRRQKERGGGQRWAQTRCRSEGRNTIQVLLIHDKMSWIKTNCAKKQLLKYKDSKPCIQVPKVWPDPTGVVFTHYINNFWPLAPFFASHCHMYVTDYVLGIWELEMEKRRLGELNKRNSNRTGYDCVM